MFQSSNWDLRQDNSLFQANSAPLSPEDVESAWDEILSKSAPMSVSTSEELVTFPVAQQAQQVQQQQSVQAFAPPPPHKHYRSFQSAIIPTTINEGFTSYFDSDSMFSNELCTTPETSNSNSPVVKVENKEDMIPMFNSLSDKLESIQKANDLTPKSLESIFDTKDILKDEPTTNYTSLTYHRRSKQNSIPSESSSNDENFAGEESKFTRSSSVGSNSSSSSSAAYNVISRSAPKKRAPRKRLTDSQKQAHNKIEKKYRININAKIAGLQNIIPSVAAEKTAFETGKSSSSEDAAEASCNRLNKSMILEKAIDYILHLQEQNKSVISENSQLKEEIAALRGQL